MRPLPALPLLALLAAAAAAQSVEGRLAALRSSLTHGDWNDRMHAVQELGPLREGAEPLLRLAADDADWQVRLAAVHQLGRLGEPAIPALADVLLNEPCRHVRITAIHWLGSMGEPAAPVLERALEDESKMLRVEDRYWLNKMGKRSDFAPGEVATASREDLNLCATSRLAGRLDGRSMGDRKGSEEAAIAGEINSTRPEAPDASTSYRESLAAARDFAVHPSTESFPDSPAVPARNSSAAPAASLNPSSPRDAELDGILGLGPQQTLPPGDSGASPREEPSSEAKLLALAARAKPDAKIQPPPPDMARQTLPPGAAGAAPREESRPGARLEADAGAPKPETDPVPALLEQLKSGNPRARARAADELGKRGQAAKPALPALRRALEDAAPRVRAGAALALGNLGDDGAAAALFRAARDKNEDVRWSATVALGRLKSPRARAAFRRLVGQQPKVLGSP